VRVRSRICLLVVTLAGAANIPAGVASADPEIPSGDDTVMVKRADLRLLVPDSFAITTFGVGGSSPPAPSDAHCSDIRAHEGIGLEFRYQLRPETVLLLAPRAAKLASKANDSAPPGITYWARLARYQRHGVKLLRAVGLTDRQIRSLAAHEFIDTTGSLGLDVEVTREVGFDPDRLGDAPAKFARYLRKHEPLRKAERPDFLRVAELCGVIPDSSVDCSQLLTNDEVARVLGEVGETRHNAECYWLRPGQAGGLVVRVYATDATFGWLTSVYAYSPLDPVSGVGEEAVSPSVSPIGTLCGNTLIARAAGRTVVVGGCEGLKLADDELAFIANTVIARLA